MSILISDLATSKSLSLRLQADFNCCSDVEHKKALLREVILKHGIIVLTYAKGIAPCEAFCEGLAQTGLAPSGVYALISDIVAIGQCEGVILEMFRDVRLGARTTRDVLVSCACWQWRFNMLYQSIMSEARFKLLTEHEEAGDAFEFEELLLKRQEQNLCYDTLHVYDELPHGKAHNGLGRHLRRPKGYYSSDTFVDKLPEKRGR